MTRRFLAAVCCAALLPGALVLLALVAAGMALAKVVDRHA